MPLLGNLRSYLRWGPHYLKINPVHWIKLRTQSNKRKMVQITVGVASLFVTRLATMFEPSHRTVGSLRSMITRQRGAADEVVPVIWCPLHVSFWSRWFFEHKGSMLGSIHPPHYYMCTRCREQGHVSMLFFIATTSPSVAHWPPHPPNDGDWRRWSWRWTFWNHSSKLVGTRRELSQSYMEAADWVYSFFCLIAFCAPSKKDHLLVVVFLLCVWWVISSYNSAENEEIWLITGFIVRSKFSSLYLPLSKKRWFKHFKNSEVRFTTWNKQVFIVHQSWVADEWPTSFNSFSCKTASARV